MRKFTFHLNKATLKAKLVGAKLSAYALKDEKSTLSALLKEAWRISVLSLGKVKSLSSRVRIFNNFMQHVFRVNRSHGASFTIKWLKGNSVAVQRFIAGSPYRSLREAEPDLPLPRLYNGLPGVIPQGDRRLIRNGHPGIIRFWLSMFNTYRILDAPLKPKISTITAPYTGQDGILLEFKDFVSQNLWKILPGSKPSDIRTSASYIFKSQSAGPNTYNAIYSYFTDLCWWAQSEEDYSIFKDYCRVSKSRDLFRKFDDSIYLLHNLLTAGARVPVKGSFGFDSSVDSLGVSRIPSRPGEKRKGKIGYVNPVSLSTPLRGGQLSLKIEAAGKVRVFAIADIWTQSVLQPLHDSIFRVLRRLPNDGTFDQEASFKRSQDKASIAKSAFSVDLSAATDRLPIIIQGYVLDVLTGIEGFGSAWSRLLTNREWFLPPSQNEVLQETDLPFGTGLKYAVGQPMGALSSWGMLALTHHLIVQFAAHRVRARALSPWYDNYEVLGDDIVIFDDYVYSEYLVIMNALGVDCNPSKSIPSPSRPVCEFAKRTSLGLHDVSGLSWKEFLQGNNLPGKINLALRLGNRMLISSECLLKAILVRFGSDMRSPLKVGIGHGLIGILGSLLGKLEGKSLVSAVSLLVDPLHLEGEDYEPTKVSVPIRQAVQAILFLMNKDTQFDPSSIISHYDDRKDFARSEILPFASQTAYLSALAIVKDTVSRYDDYVTSLAGALIDLSRVQDKVLKAQVRSIAEDILLRDTDPQDKLDALEHKIQKFREEPPLHEALELLKEAEAYSNSFRIMWSRPKGEIPTENSLALIASRAGAPVPRYWDAVAEFQGYPELGLLEKDWLRAA